MEFCEECDAVLQPKKVDGKVVPWCPDCKKSRAKKGSLNKISYEDEQRKADPDGGKILVFEQTNKATVGRPRKEMFCKFEQTMQEVEYWEIQTRSADESPTRFFKCMNCEKQWREYD